MKNSAIVLISAMIATLYVPSILGQSPPTHTEIPAKRSEVKDAHDRYSNLDRTQQKYKVTVRSWNPERRFEIVHLLFSNGLATIETDPAPFPVREEKSKNVQFAAGIEISELIKAINGTHELNPGLRLEGTTLYVARSPYITGKFPLVIKREGIISSSVRKRVGEHDREQVYVPLKDVVKALGGTLEIVQTAGEFVITIGNKCMDCLLEFAPPDDSHPV